jgi:hypothetical protein
MKRRIAALLMVMGFMLATATPAALAQGEGFDQGVGGSDPQPGQTEKAQSSGIQPPQDKPGGLHRSDSSHGTTDSTTGFGKRVNAHGG